MEILFWIGAIIMVISIVYFFAWENNNIPIVSLVIGFVGFACIFTALYIDAETEYTEKDVEQKEIAIFNSNVLRYSLGQYDAVVTEEGFENVIETITIYLLDENEFRITFKEYDFPIDIMVRDRNSYYLTYDDDLIWVDGFVNVCDDIINGKITIRSSLDAHEWNVVDIEFTRHGY